MAFFRAKEGERVVARIDLNGKTVAEYREVLTPTPLIQLPLRVRGLKADIFSGSKLKLERARSLVAEVAGLLNAYVQSGQLECVHYPIPGGGFSYRVRVMEKVPPSISVIVGDAIHNLRSALDLMVCDLIRANGNVPGRNSGFPVSTGGVTLQTAGVSESAANFLARIRSSPRWNELVWTLHQLDLIDKHNRVLAVSGATVSIRANVGMPFLSWGASPEKARPFPGIVGAPAGIRNVFLDQDEAEVYRSNPWAVEEVRIRVTPVFAPDLPAAGEPILDMLQLLGGAVERLLVLAERRLYNAESL